MSHRHRVRCWMCGYESRRIRRPKPTLRPWSDPVLLSARYGDCPRCQMTHDEVVPLLPRGIALRVLRRAIRMERRGANRTSEYDL